MFPHGFEQRFLRLKLFLVVLIVGKGGLVSRLFFERAFDVDVVFSHVVEEGVELIVFILRDGVVLVWMALCTTDGEA